MNIKKYQNRILGCIYGGVYGDTLGSITEGKTQQQILNRFPKGLSGLISKDWTDDTEMTLGLIQAIINTPRTAHMKDIVTVTDSHKKYVKRWKKNNRGYSSNTSKIFKNINVHGFNVPVNHSDTNGSIMRICPLGLVPREILSKDALKNSVVNSLWYTHNNDNAFTSAYTLCRIIHDLVYKKLTLDNVIKLAQSVAIEVNNNDIYSKLKLLEMAITYVKPDNITKFLLGEDKFQIKAIDALCCALYTFITHPNEPLSAVHSAATMGGDTDTIAKIVGDLCGSYYGNSWIPEDFNTINNKEEIISLSNDYVNYLTSLTKL